MTPGISRGMTPGTRFRGDVTPVGSANNDRGDDTGGRDVNFNLAPPRTFQHGLTSDDLGSPSAGHSPRDWRDPTPKQIVARRASSMRVSGMIRRNGRERINRLSIGGQRGTLVDLAGLETPRIQKALEPRKMDGPMVSTDVSTGNNPMTKDGFDSHVATTLFSRSKTSPLTPSRQASAHRPMATAFTDSSIRKREGAGCREAMYSDVLEARPLHSAKDCNCQSCKPHVQIPNGLLSAQVPMNKLHPAHAGTEAILPPPSSPGSPRPMPPGAGKRVGSSPTFASIGMGKVIAEYPDAEWECKDEDTFKRSLGCKTKGRSRSVDITPSPAGRFRKRHDVDLETTPTADMARVMGQSALVTCRPDDRTSGWAGLAIMRDGDDPEHRGQVAMVMTPRNRDPIPCNKITGRRRGDGEHKYYLSTESERQCLHWNQPNYRYEIAAIERSFWPPRSNSLPPQLQQRTYGGEWNPINHAGDDNVEHQRGVCRENRSWLSTGIEAVNHARVAEQEEQYRARRLVEDVRFADLCALTKQSKANELSEMATIRAKNNHKMSGNMESILTWSDE